MKTILFTVSLISLLFLLNSCEDGICERGEGSTVEEEISLDGFNSVSLSISGRLFIEEGSTQKVTIKAQSNIIDLLEKKVRDNNWNIKFRDCVTRHDDVEIYITVPDVRALKVSGSGKITGLNKFNADKLDLRISGSGDINVEADADDIESSITGSGNITLDGTTRRHEIEISGSGTIHSYGLQSQDAEVDISGSGDAKISVSQSLDVRISGSGSVLYKGSPVINTKISGSGKVKNED